MGSLTGIKGQRIYLDTNVIIYALEAIPEWRAYTRILLDGIDAGACHAVTSELTLSECLVKPRMLNHLESVKTYLDALQTREHFTVSPVSRAVLVEAAGIRATQAFKLPDAIHIATARLESCAIMVSHDQRMQNLSNI